MDLSVIIVNWNVSDLLDRCLTTIRAYTHGVQYEVIVVDSASSDDSVEMVRKKHPWVKLIACPENVGFTKGNNLGLKEARGKHILYLNPDIELIEDAISPMYAYLEAHPEVGAVGCKLLNSDRTHQRSISRYLRLSSIWREYYLRERGDRRGLPHPDETAEVEVVLGACILARGDAVRAIGGFDQRYFMYQEETDLCLALKERCLATVYFPEVSMIHHGSKSATKSEESRQRTLHENRKSQYLFLRKHYGPVIGFLGRLLIIVALLVRLPFLAALRKETKVKYYVASLRWLLGAKPASA